MSSKNRSLLMISAFVVLLIIIYSKNSSTDKVKTEPSMTNQVIEEKNEAIGESVFGIRLGENIEELRKRYSISSVPANQFKGQINKLYIVENKIPEVKDLRVQCFNGKIYEIDVFLADIKRTTFDYVVEQIRNKYSILKQTTHDESYTLGTVECSILEYEFLVRFDGEDVIISPLLDLSSGIADSLVISYTYEKLNTLVKNEYKKMRSKEKEDELKNEEVSKKRLGNEL
jgi:hypothetical protein